MRFKRIVSLRCAVLAVMTAMALVGGLLVVMYRNARADPVVRRIVVRLPDWPSGMSSVTVALLSDIHIGNAAMDAERLSRMVEQVNALHPDLVAMAGDFIAGHDPGSATLRAPGLVAPLAGLRAPFGMVAVLGNHDHLTGAAAVSQALAEANVTVLDNDAVARGPLAVAGMDDEPTRHAQLRKTLAAVTRLNGAGVLIAHSPVIRGALSPRIRRHRVSGWCWPTIRLAGSSCCRSSVRRGRSRMRVIGAASSARPGG